jgi:transposase
VPEDSATAKAIDYSLNRWEVPTIHLDDGNVQIDNNQIENLVRPCAALSKGQESMALRRQ